MWYEQNIKKKYLKLPQEMDDTRQFIFEYIKINALTVAAGEENATQNTGACILFSFS